MSAEDMSVSEAQASPVDPLERYELVENFGTSVYSTVYRARVRGTSPEQMVALKKLKMEDPEIGVPIAAIREVALIRQMGAHPNVVTLLDIHTTRKAVFLVLELLDEDLGSVVKARRQACEALDRNLETALRDNRCPGLDPPVVLKYARDLFTGLAHCHAHGVLHRDIKPQNLLINHATQTLKLADFGISRFANSHVAREYTQLVVTLWYRPPELLLGQRKYDASVDMWSAGCVLGEMLRGRPLFKGDSEIDQLIVLFRTLGTPTEESWPGVSKLPQWQPSFPRFARSPTWAQQDHSSSEAADLLTSLLSYQSSHRPTASATLHHPYFQKQEEEEEDDEEEEEDEQEEEEEEQEEEEEDEQEEEEEEQEEEEEDEQEEEEEEDQRQQ